MDSPKSDGSLSTNIEEKDVEIRRLTDQLEESRQEAYELRSRLQIAERCSRDYVTELEALQQDALEKDNQHAAAIREMQEERLNALKESEESIEHWEAKYQMMSDNVLYLQNKLEAESAKTEILSNERNEIAALKEELQEALDALTTCTAACQQHKELVSVLQKEKQELSRRVESLEQDLEVYKEHLNVSKVQLSAQTEEFKELQELLAVTQNELAALKATPNVQVRGNSLFAEVEDNRQQMVKQYKLMLVKFNHMKDDYSAKCSEIAKLKKEKSMLLDKLSVTEKEAKKHYKSFVENYEIRIKELQMTINDLKNDVKPVYLNGNDAILKFAERTVVNSRKEILSLREEMEMRSALRLNEAAELLETRGQLAQARSDLRKSSQKVKELTSALRDRENKNLLSPVQEPTTPEEEPPEKKNTAKIKFSSSLNSRKVQLEELLPDVFNRRKGIKKETVPEDPAVPQVEVSNAAATTESEKLEVLFDENARVTNEQVASDEMNEISCAADELCIQEKFATVDKVEVEERDFPVPIVSVEMHRDIESCAQEETAMRTEDLMNSVYLHDGLSTPLPRSPIAAPLLLNPTSSDYFSPKAMRSENGSALKSDSTAKKSNNLPRFDPSVCEVPCSILKVRPNCSAFENNVAVARKEVQFDDKDTDKMNLSTEEFGGTSKVKVEENKENDDEERKPVRRRPRPNQPTHPIVYMY